MVRYWRNTGGHALSGLPSDEAMIRVMKEIDLALSTEQQKLTSQRAGRQDQPRGGQDSTSRSAHTKREEARQKGGSAGGEQCAHQRGRDRGHRTGRDRRPLQALRAPSTQADSSRRHDQDGSSRRCGLDDGRRQGEANGRVGQEPRRDRSKDRHRHRSKDRHRDRSKDRDRDRSKDMSKDRGMQHRRHPTDSTRIDRSRRREREASGGSPDAKRSRDSTLGCDKKKRVAFEDKSAPAASRGWWPKQGDTPVVQQSSLGSAGEGPMLAGSNSTDNKLRRGGKDGKQPDDQCKPTLASSDSNKWVACYSKSRQRPYWFDKSTGGSVWARPAGAPPSQTK